MLKNICWASLVAFLSDFEHVVEQIFVVSFVQNVRCFFSSFVLSKTLKTHQHIAATALKASVGFVPRCEDSDGIKDLSVRPLSVEL